MKPREQEEVNKALAAGQVVLYSEKEIKIFKDFSALLDTYTFASLEQEEQVIKRLTADVLKNNTLPEITPMIEKYGFAISSNKVNLSNYKTIKAHIYVKAYGPSDRDEVSKKTIFEYYELEENIKAFLTLLELAERKLTNKELETLTEQNVIYSDFVDYDESYGIYRVTLELYLYAKSLLEIPTEQKYFIVIGNGDGYDIVYSLKEQFYYAFSFNELFNTTDDLNANDLYEIDLADEDIAVIPWLFKEAPTKEIQKKFWTF